MCKLSVITINYNNLLGLRETLDSVFSQHCHSDFEFVVIDGGSSDGSAELIQSHKDKIHYWVSEKDKGIYNAQNKGWKAAKGEYLLFLNSGDRFASSDVVKRFFETDSNADIVYGDMIISDAKGNLREGFMPDRMGIIQLYRDTLWHPVSFIKRSLFEQYGGYDESLRIVADYDFFCRVILKHKVRTRHISMFVAVFDTGGLSSDVAQKTKIAAERRIVQNRYMNSLLLFVFRIYSKIRS